MQAKSAICYNTAMQMSISQATALSSVALAYMGDAVHTLYVRRRLIESHDFKSAELTRRASLFVRAKSQAKMMAAVRSALREEEEDVARRAENTHTNNKPKNAGRGEYRLATAFEAVLGFLSLTGQDARAEEILEFTFKEEFTK